MILSEEDTRKKLVQIIKDLKPDIDVENNKKLSSSGVFESFDIILITSNIYEQIGIEIEVEDILPENFESVDTLLALLKKYTV